jgi:hypothetical protein
MKFTYEDAKAQMKAKPRKAATPPIRGKESGQPIIFDFILDITGSMVKFYDELVDCFNDIMIPSLKEAGRRYKGPMRIGCLLFSEKMVPAWQGFRTLGELESKPLKRSMLNQPGLQSWTALYGAMRAGVLWTAAAMDHMQENSKGGEVSKGKIIVLTDGANNKPPMEETAVTDALGDIGRINRRNLQSMVGFFKTDDGLTRPQFEAMAEKTGFQGLGFYEIARGGSLEEQRSSFRHYFKIFSSQATR